MCEREPLYHGGRGKECKLCSASGDASLTVGLAAGCAATALLAGLLVARFQKKRALQLLNEISENDIADAAADIQGRSQGISKSGHTKTARCIQRAMQQAGQAGVKLRIMISTAQIVGELSDTYDIRYPAFYENLMQDLDSAVNVNLQLLPFGCMFPSLDNYIFFFVLRTLVPLSELQLPFEHAACRLLPAPCLSPTALWLQSSL